MSIESPSEAASGAELCVFRPQAQNVVENSTYCVTSPLWLARIWAARRRRWEKAPQRANGEHRRVCFANRGARNDMSTADWTPERIATLIALWNEDLSTSEIGRRLGITKNAVIGKVHRLGLPQRRPSLKDEPEAADVVRLDALGANMCSWPVGNPGEANFHFCAEPSAPGKPYCPKHCAMAYIRTSRDRGVA
jgi:GcrA cell cycle regulator